MAEKTEYSKEELEKMARLERERLEMLERKKLEKYSEDDKSGSYGVWIGSYID